MEIPIRLDDLGVPPFSENTLIEPVIVNVDGVSPTRDPGWPAAGRQWQKRQRRQCRVWKRLAFGGRNLHR